MQMLTLGLNMSSQGPGTQISSRTNRRFINFLVWIMFSVFRNGRIRQSEWNKYLLCCQTSDQTSFVFLGEGQEAVIHGYNRNFKKHHIGSTRQEKTKFWQALLFVRVLRDIQEAKLMFPDCFVPKSFHEALHPIGKEGDLSDPKWHLSQDGASLTLESIWVCSMIF